MDVLAHFIAFIYLCVCTMMMVMYVCEHSHTCYMMYMCVELVQSIHRFVSYRYQIQVTRLVSLPTELLLRPSNK